MIINVNEKWRIRSDIRAWVVESASGKNETWWKVQAWLGSLAAAKDYLLWQSVAETDIHAIEERFECGDSLVGDRPDMFCWQFDKLLPEGSAEGRSLASMTVGHEKGEETILEAAERFKRSGGVIVHSESRKRTVPPLRRLCSDSGERLLIHACGRWRIREGLRSWEIEKYTGRGKSRWKFEACCISLLDAMNTLLQRRVWLIESDEPTEIIKERETIRDEILLAWRRIKKASMAA
ncbi:MAG: hypothetical protein ABIH23_03750 [bacterium]